MLGSKMLPLILSEGIYRLAMENRLKAATADDALMCEKRGRENSLIDRLIVMGSSNLRP